MRAQLLRPEAGLPLALAHRGASADQPEHTWAAFEEAVAQRADGIELDLQLTADGTLVCVHDETVDRTARRGDGTRPTGRVDAHRLDELRTFDWGRWRGDRLAGQGLVTLGELLDRGLALDPGLRFHLETKAGAQHGGRMERELVRVLGERGLLPACRPDALTAQVVVQSFEHGSLQRLRRLAPTVTTALLWSSTPPDLRSGELPPGVDIAAPSAEALLADPTFVRRAHRFGHAVHTFTVNDPVQMAQILAMGVDGIITDRPAVLRDAIGPRSARPAGGRAA